MWTNWQATEQTINDSTLQLQTVNQQQTANSVALIEAKKALDLIQATTHKNAEQFRSLLQDDQPCPVCGAFEHPWKDQAGIGNEHAEAQSARVAELESQNETLIKAIAELTKSISQNQEQKSALAEKLAEAETKLAQCGNEWAALAMHEKPDFAVTDDRLLPALKSHEEQINSVLELIRQQEKAALELQKQLKAVQDLFDADQRNKEKLSAEYAALDKQCAKNKTDLEHIANSIRQLEQQLQAIVDLLAIPFRQLENWQIYLQVSTAEFRQDFAAKAQQFQRTEQQIETAAKALETINHNERLAEQALKQCRQQHRAKQVELKAQTEEQQKLSAEREAVLPRVTADSYEQTVNQNVQTARAAHQQAGHTVSQAETELATHQQNQLALANRDRQALQQPGKSPERTEPVAAKASHRS